MIYTVDENHVYRDECGVAFNGPSVTGILDSVGLVDYSAVPEARLEHKRQIGDAVHYAARYMDEGTLDYDTIQAAWGNYLVAYQEFLDRTGFVVEEIEHSGVHTYSGMSFSFTRDRLGRFPNIKHRVVLEIKCTASEEASWPIQLAAYALTVTKAENEHIARVAVQLKPDQTFKLYNYEDPNDVKVFLWSAALVNWKIKHNIEWRNS